MSFEEVKAQFKVPVYDMDVVDLIREFISPKVKK
jgi:hypothetical protein